MSFERDQAPEQTQETNPEPQGSTFELKVGDRTYTSPEDVEKKIVNADSHISKVEAEAAELRQKLEETQKELEKQKALEEALASRGESEEATTESEPVDVQQLVASEIDKREALRVQEATFEKTRSELIDRFGEEGIDQKVAKRLEEVDAGISVTEAFEWAKDPQKSKLLLKVLGEAPQPTASFGSTQPTNPNRKTASEAQESLQGLLEGKVKTKADIESLYRTVARDMGIKV